MARKLTGVLLVSLILVGTFYVMGCGSSSQMRVQFVAPPEMAPQIKFENTGIGSGDTNKVFTVNCPNTAERLEIKVGNKTIHGKLDTVKQTELTRMSVVPIYLTSDIANAVSDFKVVTYVVYQRRRDAATARGRSGAAGEDVELRVYDYGDTLTRQALIEQAALQGEVIAVIDFGSSQYIK
ncbi:MAG: hypothetical protein IT462_01470 [Planctomycetes bacterium]|nr:hypothetical protein [Planctomycetota bacterium]